MEARQHYVYLYLDNTKPDIHDYKDWTFNYRPFYVGIGKGKRMNVHLQPHSRKDNSIKNKIIARIYSYYPESEPIRFKLYENLTKDEAKEIEVDFIATFGRIDNGTGILSNLTDGGDGIDRPKRFSEESITKIRESHQGGGPMSRVVYQYDLEGNFIKRWSSSMGAARGLGKTQSSSISDVTNKENRTAFGFRWTSLGESDYIPKVPSPSVEQVEIFHYNQGVFQKRYESLCDLVPPGLSQENQNLYCSIRYYIDNSNARPNGDQWFSKFQGLEIEFQPFVTVSERYKRKIFQYDLDGNFIAEHSGVMETREKLKVGPFSKCLSGELKSVGDFQWRGEYMGEKIEGIPRKIPRVINQIDPISNDIVKVWDSAKDAAESLSINQKCINEACRETGKLRQYKGFLWGYAIQDPLT